MDKVKYVRREIFLSRLFAIRTKYLLSMRLMYGSDGEQRVWEAAALSGVTFLTP